MKRLLITSSFTEYPNLSLCFISGIVMKQKVNNVAVKVANPASISNF